MSNQPNPHLIELNGEKVELQDLLQRYRKLEAENATLASSHSTAQRMHQQDEELKPFQAELIRLQRYLEDTSKSTANRKM